MKYSRFIISALAALLITAFYLINYKYQLSLDIVENSDLNKNFDAGFFSYLLYFLSMGAELLALFSLLYLLGFVSEEIKSNRIKCRVDERAFCDKYFLHLYATLLFVGTVAWMTALTITDTRFVMSAQELFIRLASVPVDIFSGAISVGIYVISFLLPLVYVVASLLCVVVFWMCFVQVINLIEFTHDKIEDYPVMIRKIKCVMCVSVIVILFAITLYFPLRIIFG
ncbi:hypothetical protein AU074_13720 [Pseudomonas sp. ATCC PTA-122608]|uniref:hypothetical protein n=1 Tax=Pseudomonas sp. ATCC PTA-122608 TaxID=1771311 RepID=UPI00096BB4C9|nr:hypothetical protein [Pseudomonas sp. ATCC PTA-122608]OLY72228.1 hypothetical protein AU074_13720 [Pseudomonas sp. ATCC PTA-122608]